MANINRKKYTTLTNAKMNMVLVDNANLKLNLSLFIVISLIQMNKCIQYYCPEN